VAMENTHLHAVVDQDGAAILDLDRGRVSMLNPTGAHVWQGIQRGDALEDVISSLAHETGENIQVIDRDVREFVGVLKQKGLIQY
jgi:hypothetical protein